MELTIDFSPGTYNSIRQRCEQIFEDILENIRTTITRLGQLPGITQMIWQPVIDWLWNALKEVGSFLKDLLQGIAAPIMFFIYAYQWIEDIGKPLATTEANLNQDNSYLPTSADPSIWTGDAAAAYKNATKNQSKAANVLSGRAWLVATTLGGLAVAGLAFYTSLVMIGVTVAAGITAATAGTVATAGVAAPTIPAVILAGVGQLAIAATVMAGAQMGAAYAFSQWSTEGGVFVGKAWPTGTADFSG